nr:reverse transcriptase domain-containing protein [Tanacetum cinerariifolium]
MARDMSKFSILMFEGKMDFTVWKMTIKDVLVQQGKKKVDGGEINAVDNGGDEFLMTKTPMDGTLREEKQSGTMLMGKTTLTFEDVLKALRDNERMRGSDSSSSSDNLLVADDSGRGRNFQRGSSKGRSKSRIGGDRDTSVVECYCCGDKGHMQELLQAPTKGDVPNDVIKLMMFPYSLEGAARVWKNASKTDDRIDKLADQISTLVDIVSKKVVTLATVKAVEESCVTCGGNHAYYNCDATNSNQSSVCAAMGFQNQPFQVPNNQVQQGFSNEFSSYKKANDQMMRNIQSQINSLKGEFKNEIKNTMMAQQNVLMEEQNAFQNNLQNMLSSFFQNQSSTSGTLSSNTIPNPKGEMKAITTRSGIAYEGHSIPTPKKVVEREPRRQRIRSKPISKEVPLTPNLRFADALLLMPKFASTIKCLLANKDKFFELAKIPLNENYSAILLKKLLEKLGDLGKFLIPCDFSGMDVCHALADLGASINLMPLSIWKNLSLPELTPTRMTLELVDRSITRPKGVPEDVFVKVGKFHFPTDFVVADFEVDPRFPLILGRSFLRTGRALIDVYREEITLRVNDEAVTFNLNQTTRYSFTYDDISVNRIDVIDVAREEYAQEMLDQEKTTFTCPYGTFAYRRMPFGLCNAPGTFQWCMMAIFHDMIEKTMEVFMDDFSVFRDSFSSCLSHLDTMLQRFIQDVSKIARPMTHLLEKETPFVFYKDCIDAFETLKKKLTEAPILVVPDWNLPFELMCDASDFAIGSVLGQRKTKHFQHIHYASKTMTEVQIHYTTTKNEMIAVVYAFEKFWPYLVLSKSIVYTDHSALKYLLSKQDAKPRLLRWVLLLQEFDIIICDKKRTKNLAADHLSRLENPHKDVFENKDINENFPLETLGKISSGSIPWFAHFANFHAGNFIVKGMSS